MTTYTKRFFFTLVASEDSTDTYFTIQDDNGLLWSLSDYVNDGNTSTSDIMQDIANSYFVGSNQTIYYANEDNNYILDSLTNDIYYGKDRLSDERIYNFSFSGGNTRLFYLNDEFFQDDVSSYNDYIEDSKENHDIIYDNTNGNSSIVPEDETTYTYSQDNQNEPQNERNPYTSNSTNDDTSNWSIWDFIKGIFEKLGSLLSAIGNLISDLTDAFIRLFVPSADFFSGLFDDISEWFELKLGFIFYPFQFFLDLFDRLLNIEWGEPIIHIPNINEPFSNEVLIHAVDFNFNDLLENQKIKLAHDYYLMFVDAILILGLINLLKNKFEEVMKR